MLKSPHTSGVNKLINYIFKVSLNKKSLFLVLLIYCLINLVELNGQTALAMVIDVTIEALDLRPV